MSATETWYLNPDGEVVDGTQAWLAADGNGTGVETCQWRVEVYDFTEMVYVGPEDTEDENEDAYLSGPASFAYSVQRLEGGTITKTYDNPTLGRYRERFEEWHDVANISDYMPGLKAGRDAGIAEMRRLAALSRPGQ